MYKCRHCNEEIDHLNYSEPQTEYGTCDLGGDNWDSNDTERNGSITYSCPECNHESGSTEEIVIEVDEDEDDQGVIQDQTVPSAIVEESRQNSRTRMGPCLTSPQGIQACSYCRQPLGPQMTCACQNN